MNVTIIAALIGARLTPRDAAPPARSPDVTPGRQPVGIPKIGFGSLLLIALAGFLFFMGFAFVGYVVLAFMTTIFEALQSPEFGPPDLSGIPFVPFLPLGFVLAFGGIVVAAVFAFVTGARLVRARRP